MSDPAYTSSFPAAQPSSSSSSSSASLPQPSSSSSSFPSASLPQPSSFSSLPDSSNTSAPQPSIPPIDYPSILSSSSPTLSSTSSSPSLQQTSFTFPTPPPSNSSSPQPFLSSSSSSSPSSNTYHTIPPPDPEMISPHTPTDASFPPSSSSCQSGLQDQMSLLSQGEAITSGNNSPVDQSGAVFIYPNVAPVNPDHTPVHAPSLPSQQQLPAATLPCSLAAHSATASFAFHSVPPHMQNLSFPNVSPSSAHLLSHQAQAAAFPPSSYTHPSSSLPHPPFQSSSCLAVSSSSQQSSAPSLPPAAHPQNLPNVTANSSSYPSVEIGAIPQFNPPGPYRPEMVLHHPSLLPQLDPSCLPSSAAPPPLYPAFSSYPLRLCQDPHSSLSIPLRHLYRQHQHGHAHSQGGYLDMSARAVF